MVVAIAGIAALSHQLSPTQRPWPDGAVDLAGMRSIRTRVREHSVFLSPAASRRARGCCASLPGHVAQRAWQHPGPRSVFKRGRRERSRSGPSCSPNCRLRLGEQQLWVLGEALGTQFREQTDLANLSLTPRGPPLAPGNT